MLAQNMFTTDWSSGSGGLDDELFVWSPQVYDEAIIHEAKHVDSEQHGQKQRRRALLNIIKLTSICLPIMLARLRFCLSLHVCGHGRSPP